MGPEVMLGPEVTLGAVVLAVLLTPRAHTKPHSAFAPAAGSSPVPPLCPAAGGGFCSAEGTGCLATGQRKELILGKWETACHLVRNPLRANWEGSQLLYLVVY